MNNINIDQDGNLKLGEKLNIEVLAEYKQIFDEVIKLNKPIIINGKSLTQISTIGLQLFLNFILTAKTKGLECRWHEPSNELIYAATTLGIKGFLELPEN